MKSTRAITRYSLRKKFTNFVKIYNSNTRSNSMTKKIVPKLYAWLVEICNECTNVTSKNSYKKLALMVSFSRDSFEPQSWCVPPWTIVFEIKSPKWMWKLTFFILISAVILWYNKVISHRLYKLKISNRIYFFIEHLNKSKEKKKFVT